MHYKPQFFKIAVTKQKIAICNRLATVDQGGQKNCNRKTIAVFFAHFSTYVYASCLVYYELTNVVTLDSTNHLNSTFSSHNPHSQSATFCTFMQPLIYSSLIKANNSWSTCKHTRINVWLSNIWWETRYNTKQNILIIVM